MNQFALDPRLAADSIPVTDLPLSAVRLMRDAGYPWLLLVPRRAGLTEILDLDASDQAQLMREIVAASFALKATVAPEKINVAALGNMVAQLHVHVIGRRRTDAAWPKPVWGVAEPQDYPPGGALTLAEDLALRLTGDASAPHLNPSLSTSP